jgi:hypothetical protein
MCDSRNVTGKGVKKMMDDDDDDEGKRPNMCGRYEETLVWIILEVIVVLEINPSKHEDWRILNWRWTDHAHDTQNPINGAGFLFSLFLSSRIHTSCWCVNSTRYRDTAFPRFLLFLPSLHMTPFSFFLPDAGECSHRETLGLQINFSFLFISSVHYGTGSENKKLFSKAPSDLSVTRLASGRTEI